MCFHRSATSQSGASTPPLLPSRVDHGLASNLLETQLRALTEQHREVSVTVGVCVCGFVCLALLKEYMCIKCVSYPTRNCV